MKAAPQPENQIAGSAEEQLARARQCLHDSAAQPPRYWRIEPLPGLELPEGQDQEEQLWDGYLAAYRISILGAESKAGKTTLLCLLYREMIVGGELCGSGVQPGNVVVFSEEPAHEWIKYRDYFGLAGNVAVGCMPFAGCNPTLREWQHFIDEGVRYLRANPVRLVVLDTLTHLWGVEDENNAREVTKALKLLERLTACGTSVLIVHHFGNDAAVRLQALSRRRAAGT